MTLVIEFKSRVKWVQGFIGKATVDGGTELEFALPKEFGGEGGYATPEHMVVAALLACFSAMLWRTIHAQRIELKNYDGEIVGRMDKDAEGYNAIKEIIASIKIQLANMQDAEKVQKAVEVSKKYCPVGRLMKGNTEIRFDVFITA
jgi:uncharacterized OsmC-like protein